jgi:hypothetical protein
MSSLQSKLHERNSECRHCCLNYMRALTRLSSWLTWTRLLCVMTLLWSARMVWSPAFNHPTWFPIKEQCQESGLANSFQQSNLVQIKMIWFRACSGNPPFSHPNWLTWKEKCHENAFHQNELVTFRQPSKLIYIEGKVLVFNHPISFREKGQCQENCHLVTCLGPHNT